MLCKGETFPVTLSNFSSIHIREKGHSMTENEVHSSFIIQENLKFESIHGSAFSAPPGLKVLSHSRMPFNEWPLLTGPYRLYE